jgi:hypothetical protein
MGLDTVQICEALRISQNNLWVMFYRARMVVSLGSKCGRRQRRVGEGDEKFLLGKGNSFQRGSL